MKSMHSVHKGSAAAGFSLIEVLITLVVLAVGLLGLGLLQTMNLRYTQSANQRTVATTLGGELLDTMRTNRSMVPVYAMTKASFTTAPAVETGCGVGAGMSAAQNVERWRCEVREKLGADAYAEVVVDAFPEVAVTVYWSDMPGGEAKVDLRTTL